MAMILAAGPSSSHAAENLFAAGVRSTDPQSPSQQQNSFRLPPGFEIELVASEPEIAKPMNLAFDAQGRLWVTDSYEYPFAAPLNRPGRDAIKVLEDTDGDGSYDQIQTFADGLNIPIGLYPYKNGVIAWSIPYIYYFEDTNGDGRSDRQTPLYGPLGYERDTHGMNSSFTRGFDGWLYITHGFNNNTTVRGKDGSEITMNSGNTYRVHLDGSRVEQFTYGQVNPFGMALDPLGNLYTSDCHSMPAYLLIRDAFYPSFGKPHDGLGFCPKIMEHSHGSTAIDGVVYYSDNQWPAEYRDNVMVGNVMTSRVNRDTLLEVGSGKRAKEEADFIVSDDPWFRPVNMQFGPDGSLYIADFYNRIIGHYEVPLKHPGRDRHRGRIWKVSFRGTEGQPGQTSLPFDLTRLSLSGIFDELGSPNLIRRQLALNYLTDEIGAPASARAQAIIDGKTASKWQQRVQCLWLLHRLASLNPDTLRRTARDSAREVRVHSMRVLSETKDWSRNHRQLAVEGLSDADLNVQRAAADALLTHPDPEHVAPLLSALEKTSNDTPHLKHTLRIALRNQLRHPQAFSALNSLRLNEEQRTAIADVAIAVKSSQAAGYLIEHLTHSLRPGQPADLIAKHIAQHASVADLDRLPALIDRAFPADLTKRLEIYEAIEAGNRDRQGSGSTNVKQWGQRLAASLIKEAGTSESIWTHRSVPGMEATQIPWIIQRRRSSDGGSPQKFLSSLSPGGESFTGVIRSPEFNIPRNLQFYLAGHDGYPDKSAQGRNHVRIRISSTGEVVASAQPPRNDTAQLVRWDLSAAANQKGFIEVTDSDNAGAYAWLAVGRFTPSGLVSLPSVSPQQQHRLLATASRIAGEDTSSSLYRSMTGLIKAKQIPAYTRAEIAVGLCQSHSHPLARTLAKQLAIDPLPSDMEQRLLECLFQSVSSESIVSFTAELITALPARSQKRLIEDLSRNRHGASLVLDLAEDQRLSPVVLSDSKLKASLSNHGEDFKNRIAKLTVDLDGTVPDMSSKVSSLARKLSNQPGDARNGKALFTQACQICHQINGQGALVGPQLEGIGNRGIERVLEDILDPNRNVDNAFQTQTFELKNGDVLSGLLRRESASLVYLANAAGQEVSVQKEDIAMRRSTQKSLMPENFAELLNDEQLADLVAFLLTSAE